MRVRFYKSIEFLAFWFYAKHATPLRGQGVKRKEKNQKA